MMLVDQRQYIEIVTELQDTQAMFSEPPWASKRMQLLAVHA